MIGKVYEKGAALPPVVAKIAKVSQKSTGKTYHVEATTSGINVRSEITGKIFSLTAGELIKMALTAGLEL